MWTFIKKKILNIFTTLKTKWSAINFASLVIFSCTCQPGYGTIWRNQRHCQCSTTRMLDVDLWENARKRVAIFYFIHGKHSFNDKKEDFNKSAHATLKPKHINKCQNFVGNRSNNDKKKHTVTVTCSKLVTCSAILSVTECIK